MVEVQTHNGNTMVHIYMSTLALFLKKVIYLVTLGLGFAASGIFDL